MHQRSDSCSPLQLLLPSHGTRLMDPSLKRWSLILVYLSGMVMERVNTSLRGCVQDSFNPTISLTQMLQILAKSGIQATSFRIGQLSGGLPNGAWATSDWVPILVKSSLELGALPSATGVCIPQLNVRYPGADKSMIRPFLGFLCIRLQQLSSRSHLVTNNLLWLSTSFIRDRCSGTTLFRPSEQKYRPSFLLLEVQYASLPSRSGLLYSKRNPRMQTKLTLKESCVVFPD
jgi:hypothetical protein